MYDIFKEVYIARLPVGHTHIDIDGRHAIFAMHFNGTKESSGHVAHGIMTPMEFDHELKAPYKSDKVTVFRKYGLLAFSDKVKGWLGFSNYGTPSKSSAHAKKQGCRDPEPHFYTYFKDAAFGFSRMKYKISETAQMTFPSSDGIEVIHPDHFQQAMELLHGDIDIKALAEWPNRNAVETTILGNKNLTPVQISDWKDWFANCPETTDDITDANVVLGWSVKALVTRKKKYFEELQEVYIPFKTLNNPLINEEFRQEVIVHPGHPKQVLNAERREREDKFQRRQAVEAEATVVAAVLDSEKRSSKRKR